MSSLTGTNEKWGKPVTIPHGLYFTLNNVFISEWAKVRDKERPSTPELEKCWAEYEAYWFKKGDSNG